jgi:hypothetical protein
VTKEIDVLALPARELDAGLKVSQDSLLDADQLRVVNAVPLFVTMTDCEEVAVLPCTAEKLRVEVGIERTAGFATVRDMGDEEALLP